jgi:hypothetical protein
MSFLSSVWRDHVTDLRERVDAESALYRQTTSSAAANKKLAIVCFSMALCLVFVRFAGNEDNLKWVGTSLSAIGLDQAGSDFMHAMTKSEDRRILQRIWWAVARVLGYGVLPILVIRFAFREPVSSYGTKLKGTLGSAKTYLLLFAIVAPVVIAASYGAAFQAKYPYYKLAAGESVWPNFVAWSALYGLQFVALEFFFRGFVVHGLRAGFGYASIFVPIIPYAMIHFGKPLPEALGSIITGFVLGTLSLKTDSVWGGAAIHVGVAVSMDWLAIWHRGLL